MSRSALLGSWADELVVLAGGGEHDDGDLGVAQHGELPRLLHDPRAALGVGDLPVGRVLDPLDLDLAPPHLAVGILVGQLRFST